MATTQDLDAVQRTVQSHLERYGDPKACAAALLCDDHPADAVAFTIIEPDLSTHDLTYGWLREQSECFAGGLRDLGIAPGDRVATLMGKSADLIVAVLGIWRLGAVHVPLFTAFAPGGIAIRVDSSETVAVICDPDQRAKLDPSDAIPASPAWQIITAGDGAKGDDRRFADLLTAAPLERSAVLGGRGPLVEIYTSGTTGQPKGVVLPIFGVAALCTYLDFGLDLRDEDVYWNVADPGWAYGLWIAVIAPMAMGKRSLLLHGAFTPDIAWRVLAELGVTNLAAAPTAYRAMRASGGPDKPVRLRCASSAGEPLTPEVNEWSVEALGVEVHDQYGQTEQGMLVMNHHHPALAKPIKPGSMGHPMPGVRVEVLKDDSDEVAAPDEVGRVAVAVNDSPLWFFDGYRKNPEATSSRFTADGKWYLTGDAGRVDDEGYVTFCSRDDDLIITAGYRIGPFEIESVLAGHPAVVESAVIAVPDQLRGEVIEAFVVARDDVTASTELGRELQVLVKERYAAHAYPRQVHFVDALPKTPSGKIQRFVLRERRTAELAGQVTP